MKTIVWGGVVVIVVVLAAVFMGSSPNTTTLSAACGAHGSTWDATKKRCTFGMAQSEENEQWCSEYRGSYDSCTKGTCPEGMMCPAVCIASCSF